MGHVVLLGDSIFDNAAYVGGGPDVVAQLRAALPADWRATLLAVDGAVATDVQRQLGRLPADATDLVLSAGGNDAPGHAGLLERRARSGGEVLGWFAEAVGGFAQRYRAMLARVAEVAGPGRRVVVCTIYEGNLGGGAQRAAATAIGMFDDVIARAARERGWEVLELRDLFREPADYANPIEPSVRGGEKMARAIAALVSGAPR
jgi:hypothetical protein